jgi:head-tail adaptor
MNLISSRTINDLKKLNERAMMDSCTVLKWTPAGNDRYNMPVDGWVDSSAIRCAFRYLNTKEVEASAVDAEAEIIVSQDVEILPADRVRVTTLENADVYKTFNVIGGKELDYTGIRYMLKSVTEDKDDYMIDSLGNYMTDSEDNLIG